MEGAEIRRLEPGDDAALVAASPLFDGPVAVATASRFLAAQGHHLFLATIDDVAVGFISGVETTHPDKGTEMFLYELAVDEDHRRRGIQHALMNALAAHARTLGCYGMWVGTEADNEAAIATYLSAGAEEPEPFVTLTWSFTSDDE